MSSTIRITCKYHPGLPPGLLQWMADGNKSFHPPHVLIEGREVQLAWDRPTDVQVASGCSQKVEVYFRVFEVLRFCGAEVQIESLRDGETRAYEYVVEFNDHYLKHGRIGRVG